MKESARRTFIQDLREDEELILAGIANKKMLHDAVQLAYEYEPIIKAIPINFATYIVDKVGADAFNKFFSHGIDVLSSWNENPPQCLDRGFRDTLANILEIETLGHILPDIANNPYSKGLRNNMAHDEIINAINEIRRVPVCQPVNKHV